MNVVVEARDVRALRSRPRVPDHRAPGAVTADVVPPVRGAVNLKCHLAGHELVARTAWQQVGRFRHKMAALHRLFLAFCQIYQQTCESSPAHSMSRMLCRSQDGCAEHCGHVQATC